jgi:diaminopimelate epimerase
MLAEQNNSRINFVKMSGAGNDFVIFDARKQKISLSSSEIKKISNRKNIGCDQIIIIKNDIDVDCLMEIFNSDGSLSGACGNATRCVAEIIISEKKTSEIKIKTAAGILKCWREDNLISVNMGKPKFFEEKILLHGFEFIVIDVGNPHAVCFVDKIPSNSIFFDIGPKIETDKIFPNKTNVEFAKIISDELIEARVWERGVGETLACGSGACAVGVAAIKQNLIRSKKTIIRFKGGDLFIQWNKDQIIMTGGYEKIFYGEIDQKFL